MRVNFWPLLFGVMIGWTAGYMVFARMRHSPMDTAAVIQFRQDTSNPMIVSPTKVDYRGKCWVQHDDGTSQGWLAREDGICYSADEPK